MHRENRVNGVFGSSNLVKCVFVHLENDVYNQGFKKTLFLSIWVMFLSQFC